MSIRLKSILFAIILLANACTGDTESTPEREVEPPVPELQETEVIIAPSIKTEGKLFQTVQSVGMGTR